MNPFVILINLLAVAPAVLGRTVGLQVAGIPAPVAWSAQAGGPLLGWLMLAATLGLLLLAAGLRLFGQSLPEE